MKKQMMMYVYLGVGVLVMISIVIGLRWVVGSLGQPQVQVIDVATSRVRPAGAMDHPSSCYSCEKQYDPRDAWQGQKSKCFSCEQDYATRGGSETPFDAHPIRYY